MLAIEARESRNAVSAALLIHGLLAAALLFSLQWNKRTPPVQAELWSGMPRDLPASVSPPTPAVKPTPAAPPTPAPQVKADISLQKKKEEPKKPEPKKAEPPKEDPLKEKERQEALKKEAEKKLLAEKKAAEQLEAQRKAELARLLGIDPNAKPGAQGKDAATKAGVAAGGAEIGSKTGADADYEAMIQTRIRLRITYPDRSNANPEAIVRVDQLPSGEVTAVKLIHPSGTPAWDEAVQRAIWAASPLPKRKDGTVARVLELTFRPKESR